MRSFNRISAFFSKWTAELVRQPALMFTLVVGPFLVLLAFGEGVNIGGPRPRTLIVRPEQSAEMQPLPEELNDHIDVVGETSDANWARSQLEKGKVDVVAVLPPDPAGEIRQGRHIPIQILTSEIDPVRKSYARAYLSDQVAELNQRTIEKAVREAQSSIGDVQKTLDDARPFIDALRSNQGNLDTARAQVADLRRILVPLNAAAAGASAAARGVTFVLPGFSSTSDQATRLEQLVASLQSSVDKLDAQLNGSSGKVPSSQELDDIQANLTQVEQTANDIKGIPPEVLSAPFQLKLDNVAPFVPTFTGFYAPAVLALLIQHLAITLGALSLARIRLIGLMDLLRTSPVRASEVVFGNYLSYGTLCAIAGAVLVTLTVVLLGVPVFGSYWLVALSLGLLIVTSLGVGFVISMWSSSEQQAAQVSMLILLASIFFSGFVFSLDRIAWPVRAVSYALPTTYAIRTLQDVMLRGVLREPVDLAVLAISGLFLLVLTVYLFKREFRPSKTSAASEPVKEVKEPMPA